MAEATVEGIQFSGLLNIDVEDAINPDLPSNFFADSYMIDRMRVGTTGCFPESRLWLGSPQMCFGGLIAAVGDERIHEWRYGFIQSVLEAFWNGYYSDGKIIRNRLNTTYGPLKDGPDDCIIEPEWRFIPAESAGIYRGEVISRDGPAHMYFREFSGDPSHPNQQAEGTRLGQLTRTEGKYCFHTYLAALNQCRKSIVTLSDCHWTIVWNGDYDFMAKKWTPEDENQVLRHEKWDRAHKFEHMTLNSPTPPFSLFMDKAKKSWEVLTDEGWVPCRECYPTQDKDAKPTRKTWLHS